MRRSATMAGAAAMFALACSGDAPTGATLKPGASAASRGQSSVTVSRPIGGRCESTVLSLTLIGDGVVREEVGGPCWISHLGRTTLYLRQVIDFNTGQAVSEEVTFTAANGDVLRATSITIGTPTSATTTSLAGTFTFVGGTGRFAHASGSAPFAGSVDFATGKASFTMRGTIAYAASDRADDDGE